MSDDPFNYEIIFNARMGSGLGDAEKQLKTIEQRIQAVITAQNELIASGDATAANFKYLATDLQDFTDKLAGARETAKLFEEQMKVIGSDRLQNLSGALDQSDKAREEARQKELAVLRADIVERNKLMEQWLGQQNSAQGITNAASSRIDSRAIGNLPTAGLQAEQNKLIADAKLEVEALTKAYVDEGIVATATGDKLTTNEQAARLQNLRQKVNDVTLAYEAQIKVIKEAADGTRSGPYASGIGNTQQIESATRARERELAVLRQDITERNNQAVGIERAGKAEGDYAKAALGDEAAIRAETLAREKELAVLKQDIIERDRLAVAKKAELGAAVSQGNASIAQTTASTSANNTLGNFYPLIVAGATFGTIGKKLEDLGLAATKTSAEYEAAFANVARTTNADGANASAAINGIKKSLMDLDTQIPLSFKDLSKIAAAGNEIGIGAAGIAGFTKTVAEYSTVTGTAADVTATAFGSLGKILQIPETEFENFGAAVSLVGRKSVATEAQVLAMTARIGATAHAANFSTAQIIGLSGALASLQEAPERSQGALEIYFKKVNAAAADGGKALDKFAEATHLSASAAKDLITNDPYSFLIKLLQAIGKEKGIVAQTTLLNGLGLSAVRVSEVLRRLSGESGIGLIKDLTAQAAQGYAQGTDLASQYAQATNTLSAKLKELSNAFSNLLATIGGSGIAQSLIPMVAVIKDVVVGLTNFAEANPVITDLIVLLTTFAGTLFLARTAQIAATISTIALEGAQTRLKGVNASDGFRVLTGILLGYEAKTKSAAAAAEVLATKQKEVTLEMTRSGVVATETEAMRVLGITEYGVAAGADAAATGLGLVRGVLSTLGIPLLIAGLSTVLSLLASSATAVSSIDTGSFGDALKADQATYEKTGAIVKEISVTTEESKTKAYDWVKSLDRAAGSQADLNKNTQQTTTTIKDQTVAYGKNGEAAVKSALANNAAFQKLFSNATVSRNLQKVGFDPAEFAKRIVGDPTGAAGRDYVQKYLNMIETEIKQNTGKPDQGRTETANALLDLGGIIDDVKTKTQAAATLAAAFAAANGDVKKAVDGSSDSLSVQDQLLAAHQALLNQSTADEQKFTAALFAPVNAFYAQSAALSTVGQEYVQNGAAAAFSGAAFQSYIKSIEDNNAPQFAAARLVELRNAIVASGKAASATAPELAYLNAEIDHMGGSDSKVIAKDPFQSFMDGVKQAEAALAKATRTGSTGFDNVGNSAAKAKKAIRDVTDYANDLGSVFKTAFEIRFGPEDAQSAIHQQFQTMQNDAKSAKQNIDAANQSIKQYEASISKARVDNTQQRYFLAVANQFGDAASAAQAQSNIDNNNASISGDQNSLLKAQQDRKAAQDALSKSTDGMTAGQIANRLALEALAQKYQDYIVKLAASGANQKTLNEAVRNAKEDFDKEATALGYNRDQINRVSGAFTDMVTIIKHIPPANITVTGLNAGQIAIKDFMEKAKATVAAGISSINQGIKGIGDVNIPTPHFTDPNSPREILRSAMETDIQYKERQITELERSGVNSNALLAKIAALAQEQRDYGSGNYHYSSGGYTGPGGVYEPAGIVHKGEYVVPQSMVNQQTGLPYADALGRLISGTRPQVSYATGGFVNPDMMVVEPGPRFTRMLREIAREEAVALITPGAIAGAANSANAANRRRGRG